MRLNQPQILDLYMIFGGIPHYLGFIQKGQSVPQCIDEICFQKGGALIYEFDRLFAALFNDAENYIHLIRLIAQYPNGIEQSKLMKDAKISDGGRTKQRLKALEDAGFILEFIPYGHQQRGIFYKVVDEFTLFYLRWMEPVLNKLLKQERGYGYWLSKTKSPHWRSWSALAFESVCYKHLVQIRKALKIDPGAEIGSWRYYPRSKVEQGAQIDLLFDRDDGIVTICEIKYNEHPFVIDKEYARKLQAKIEAYRKHGRISKSIFLTLILANELKPSLYSEEMIAGVVVLDDLFKAV